jgi:hypothetical protein
MRIWSSLIDYFGLLDNSAVLHTSYIIRGPYIQPLIFKHKKCMQKRARNERENMPWVKKGY